MNIIKLITIIISKKNIYISFNNLNNKQHQQLTINYKLIINYNFKNIIKYYKQNY